MFSNVESSFAYYGGILNSYNDINRNPLMRMALEPFAFGNTNVNTFNNVNTNLLFNTPVLAAPIFNTTVAPVIDKTNNIDLLTKLLQILNNKSITPKTVAPVEKIEVPVEKPVESNETEMTDIKAAQILKDNLDLFDQAAGFGVQDHRIGKADLEAIAKNNSPEMEQQRKAAQFLLDNQSIYDAIDVAHTGGDPNGLIGARGLQAYIDKQTASKVEVPVENTQVVSEKTVESSEPQTAKLTEDQKQLIIGHFDWFAGNSGDVNDGFISKQDLEAVTKTTCTSQIYVEKRKAAQFILDNQNVFVALDVAAGDNKTDGLISLNDIKGYIA